MKINIKEKFNLIGKLETLSEAVKDHRDANAICVTAIHEFNKGINWKSFSHFLENLNRYNWINEVDSFISEYSKFISENKNSIKLEGILESLESSDFVSTYQPAIDTLKELVQMNESDAKKDIHKLNAYRFIPALRSFVAQFEQEEFAVIKTIKAEVEKSHISPVMVIDEGYVFHLNGLNYVTDSKLSKLEKFEGNNSTSEYSFALKAMDMFTISENEFVMETAKGLIKIISSEEGNKFFIGENEFVGRKAISSALTLTGVVNYFDKDTKSVLEFMYENAHKYAIIECVKNIKVINENIKLSFIKLSNNRILFNQVNDFERTNEMIEVTGENFDSIVESFAVGYKLDILPVLESIKVNLKAIDFKKKVDDINLSDMIQNADTVLEELSAVKESYDNMSDSDKEDCESSFKSLDEKISLANSNKVKFLLEAKAKYQKEDVEGLEDILNLLDSELKEALGKVNEEASC